MGIIIGADIVPMGPDLDFFINGNVEELIGKELLDILSEASYRIFNLEVPLTDTYQPIQKNGPILIAPTSAIKGIKLLGVDLLTLANNHIMDQGVHGLASTIQELVDNGISYVGVGQNNKQAQQPFFFSVNDRRYGVYACAEHEFSIADEKQPGANPFDPLESLDHIAQMKSNCDYVIVLYHGGKEYYRYPSPNLQKTCRKIVDKGADIVICQHSHCIGCMEKYKNGTIIYGQGNFLFNRDRNECWFTGILVNLNESGSISYIPFIKQQHGVRLAKGKEAEDIISSFERRSKEIEDSGFVEKKFKEFADQSISGYILSIVGTNRSFLFRVINKLTGQKLYKYVLKHTMNSRGLELKSYIECEAHRELLLKGIELKTNE